MDLIIRNGEIVDGTGSGRFRGDIAIRDGVIAGIEPRIDASDVDEIDATGMLVTPGFVDVHTHYDGQATWDEVLAPSSDHGVTTVVMGNCGVGFAPVRPGRESWLVQLMEGVEDIPGAALHEGISWGWESFAEYLDVLDVRRYSVDVAAYVPHGPVRGYVMGERGARNEPATPDDIAKMATIVRGAVEAGALGFSTSRTIVHKARDGEPVPGTFAALDELNGLADAVHAGGGRLFEVAPQGLEYAAGEFMTEVEWMIDIAQRTGLTTSFLMLQNMQNPTAWREALTRLETVDAPVHPQVAARPFGMLLGWASYHPFAKRPTFVELAASLPLDELTARLADPTVRKAILSEDDLPPDPSEQFDMLAGALQTIPDRLYPLDDPPDYEPTEDNTLAARAKDAGVDPMELAYDVMCSFDGRGMMMFPVFNYENGNHDDIREMLVHPSTISGLSDGGAHCRMICDASYPTYLLTHWARDRSRGPKLRLEDAVKLQTGDTAAFAGLNDRGVLTVGRRADINVIDLPRLDIGFPRAVDDLPAGGRRLLQGATGYVATLVAGEVTRRDGSDTGARPGRLVRGAR
jgi:N-acyl-D-aspartate/D-glutamate deacylase